MKFIMNKSMTSLFSSPTITLWMAALKSIFTFLDIGYKTSKQFREESLRKNPCPLSPSECLRQPSEVSLSKTKWNNIQKNTVYFSLTSANREKRKNKKMAKQFYFVVITMSSNNRILQTLFNPIIVFESPTMVGVSTFYKHLE